MAEQDGAHTSLRSMRRRERASPPCTARRRVSWKERQRRQAVLEPSLSRMSFGRSRRVHLSPLLLRPTGRAIELTARFCTSHVVVDNLQAPPPPAAPGRR